eukprot:353149-Chlamydomonas_euryale.AAC.6
MLRRPHWARPWQVRSFFAPALDWIAKWLPLFYVPALVTLPLALQGLAGVDARVLRNCAHQSSAAFTLTPLSIHPGQHVHS